MKLSMDTSVIGSNLLRTKLNLVFVRLVNLKLDISLKNEWGLDNDDIEISKGLWVFLDVKNVQLVLWNSVQMWNMHLVWLLVVVEH